jgi:hypothetical protein
VAAPALARPSWSGVDGPLTTFYGDGQPIDPIASPRGNREPGRRARGVWPAAAASFQRKRGVRPAHRVEEQVSLGNGGAGMPVIGSSQAQALTSLDGVIFGVR